MRSGALAPGLLLSTHCAHMLINANSGLPDRKHLHLPPRRKPNALLWYSILAVTASDVVGFSLVAYAPFI